MPIPASAARLASLVRWRRHRLRLTAGEGVVATQGRWHLTGPRGCLTVCCDDVAASPMPAGRAVLSYDLDWDGEPPMATLEGGGAQIRLPLRRGAVRILVELPPGLTTLRLDAAAPPPAGFAIRTPCLTEAGPLMGALAMLWGWVRPALTDHRELARRARHVAGLLTSRHGRTFLMDRLSRPQGRSYADWVRRHDAPDAADRQAIAARIAALPQRPLLSVLLPVADPPEAWLNDALAAVLDQLYPDWELCVSAGPATGPHLMAVLEGHAARDPRVRVVRCAGGAATAPAPSLDAPLAIAGGAHCVLLDPGTVLAPHALFAVAAHLCANPDADLVYSDEDRLDGDGHRTAPYFKPDFNPDLLLTHNLMSHLAVVRTALLRTVEPAVDHGMDAEGQGYDRTLRGVEASVPQRIHHIAHILCHRRTGAAGPAPGDARRAIAGHLARTGHADATVGPAADPALHRVVYPLPAAPGRVTVIVPTKDRLDLLARCVDGVLDGTDYPDVELVVVDNRSEEPATKAYLAALADRPRARVLVHDQPYNYSAINNEAVAATAGAFVCFLNNDIEVIEPGWLAHMVSHARRREIGAVGAKLLYPDRTVQHAGIVLDAEGIAWHAHRGLPRHHPGDRGRALLQQTVSAVTAACMVMRRTVFDEVGGFDAENLAIAFNDVDLCLRLGERGYRVLWTPYAELVHHESATLGDPASATRRPQFRRESAYMARRWAAALACDPAFNPNLDPHRSDFAPAFPPRLPKPWSVS